MSIKPSYRRAAERRVIRRGSACVEAAICLPVLFGITIATMDICSALFLRETVTLAAYEGARSGVSRSKTNADARTRVAEFLAERGVQFNGATAVTISSPGFDDANTLDNVTVTVTVPCQPNLIMPTQLFFGSDISASVTMRKEFENN